MLQTYATDNDLRYIHPSIIRADLKPDCPSTNNLIRNKFFKESGQRDYTRFYINSEWVAPTVPKTLDVINPANEEVCRRINLGAAADVDRTVAAARTAFASFSQTSREERLVLLERIVAEYKKRYDDMAAAITEEMGAPSSLAQQAQAVIGSMHFQTAIGILKDYEFQTLRGSSAWVAEGQLDHLLDPELKSSRRNFPSTSTRCR